MTPRATILERTVTISAGAHAAVRYIEGGDLHPPTVSISVEGAGWQTIFSVAPDHVDMFLGELAAAAAEARTLPVREFWQRPGHTEKGAGS